MTDPERQPIAALLKEFRDIEAEYAKLLDAGDQGTFSERLEAAIAAQVALWDADEPCEPSCTCHRRKHIADLQGKEGPEPNG